MEHDLRHLVAGNARPAPATVEQFEPRLMMNSAPVIDPTIQMAWSGQGQFDLQASFQDADTADAHTAVIDWGDQTSDSVDVTEADGAGSFAGQHAFSDVGTYHVTITLSDGTDTATRHITVIAATAGNSQESSEGENGGRGRGSQMENNDFGDNFYISYDTGSAESILETGSVNFSGGAWDP